MKTTQLQWTVISVMPTIDPIRTHLNCVNFIKWNREEEIPR